MPYGQVVADTQIDSYGAKTAPISVPFRNRIINGAMVIDQRNAGVEVNPAVNGSYYLDRWRVNSTQTSIFKIGQNAGSVTTPVGFTNYLGCTSLSAYSVLSSDIFCVGQFIEGFNIADLNWGTASAQTVTLSFQVRSSLTGTFGGSISNNAVNRSYPFTYTIPSANTWTTISITIAGDTTGTWVGATNGIGIRVFFGLGVGTTYSGTAGSWAGADYRSVTGATSVVGTNGATFYITGVQLEKGSNATSFDYRPYTTELSLCQRYYYKWVPTSSASYIATCNTIQTTATYGWARMPVTMRTTPTLFTSGTASDYGGYVGAASFTCNAVPNMDTSNTDSPLLSFATSGGLTLGQTGICGSKTINGFLGFNAEL